MCDIKGSVSTNIICFEINKQETNPEQPFFLYSCFKTKLSIFF